MNDLFLRQRVNQLTGLTKFTQKIGTSTVIPASQVWTNLDITNLTTTDRHLVIVAYRVTTSTSDMQLRMVAEGDKIFPFGNSTEAVSGVDQLLQFPIQVPTSHSFSIQLSSVLGGTAILDYLSVIEVANFNYV